jgi:DNA helicase-2/ATP-dependent DNA helicase PcrA
LIDRDALARELNPPQLEAALRTDGPLLVFAGAGSGKTRVITFRVAHILDEKNVPPWRILAVTFTNKAAQEMRERLHRIVGHERARGLWISTFHALGARLLRRFHERAGLRQDFAIYDDGDQRSVMNRVFDELKIDEKFLPVRNVLGAIDRAKQEVLEPDDLMRQAVTLHDKQIARAWEAYEKHLEKNGAVDFGDLLAKLTRLVERDASVREELQEQFQYLLVDEFQDTNACQYRMLRAMVNEQRNLCVVGDDDQAIYRWRGADVRNIQYFKRDFPDALVVKLEQNYRSTQRILKAANAVISKAQQREGKTLFTRNGEGAPIELMPCEDEREEARHIAHGVKSTLARGVPAKEIAVFYRIHAQSRPLEDALRAANIPYMIYGGMRFYERAEVKDILAYLRMVLNPNDDVSLLRVVNTPARKIGKTTLDRVTVHATARQTSIWKLLATGDLPDDVGGAGRKALTGFYLLMGEIRREAAAMLERPAEVGRLVFQKTGYARMLEDNKDIENETRHENIEELLGSMHEYAEEADEPTLSGYLERVTLNEETPAGEDVPKVSLMTVHSAKGLEFRSVYIAAMEDGMFPYKGTELGSDPEEMEEERRLAYVAITRAREHLTVSFTRFRQIFGQTRINPPSRFLLEMPEEVLSGRVPRRHFGEGSTPSRDSGGGWGHGGGGGGGGYRVERDPVPARAREPEAPALDGPVLVRDNPAVGWQRGMRVRHMKFGTGTVKTVFTGAELKLEVYFPNLGATKTLLAEYLQALG